MDYYSNHCACRNSHWNDDVYYCRHIVTIERYLEDDDIWDDKPTKDWKNTVVDIDEYIDEKAMKEYMKKRPKLDEKAARLLFLRETRRLRPKVVNWLNENVKPIPRPKKDELPHGWCMGNDSFNSNENLSFRIFFYRKSDAIKFIEHWSEYKKPTGYFNYFKNIKKELDMETGRLIKV